MVGHLVGYSSALEVIEIRLYVLCNQLLLVKPIVALGTSNPSGALVSQPPVLQRSDSHLPLLPLSRFSFPQTAANPAGTPAVTASSLQVERSPPTPTPASVYPNAPIHYAADSFASSQQQQSYQPANGTSYMEYMTSTSGYAAHAPSAIGAYNPNGMPAPPSMHSPSGPGRPFPGMNGLTLTPSASHEILHHPVLSAYGREYLKSS